MTPEEKKREIDIKLKILALHRLLIQKSIKSSSGFITEQTSAANLLQDQLAYLIFVLDAYRNVLTRIN